MFNYSLVIRMLGNAYLGLVGLAKVFAGIIAWLAIAEVDRLGEQEDGLLGAAYGVLGCFSSTAGAIALAIVLTAGGLGFVIVAAFRLRANLAEPRHPVAQFVDGPRPLESPPLL